MQSYWGVDHGDVISKSAKRDVWEGTKTGAAVGGIAGAGLGAGSSAAYLATPRSRQAVASLPARTSRVTARALTPVFGAARGAVGWAIPGAAIGAAGGYYHHRKNRRNRSR